MRVVGKLSMLVVAALTAIALAAPAAVADASVEVENETAGGHCAPIALAAGHTVTGGCVVHFTGQMYLAQHTGMQEVLTSNCFQEFTARVDEEGSAFIYGQAMVGTGQPPVGCNVEACDESPTGITPHANLRWPAVFFEGETEAMDYPEGVTVAFCLRAGVTEGGAQNQCTIVIDLLQDGHRQFLEAEDFSNPASEGESCAQNPATEVSGFWFTEETLAPGEHAIGLMHGDG